jgi:hypothetical protein
MKLRRTLLVLAVVVLGTTMSMLASAPSGAGFTTGITDGGTPPHPIGCLDSPNGIDCNNYELKTDVYMSGGPTAAGLSNGGYYFAVLVPGFQNTGYVQGFDGNLSDDTQSEDSKSNTDLSAGGGDAQACRTFHVTNHQIDQTYTADVGSCAHATGFAPNGRFIIQLAPYDNTTNRGGVYILAICSVDALSPSDCKYDAFRVHESEDPCDPEVEVCTPGTTGELRGSKYYDANTNGRRDGSEVGIANWPINIHDAASFSITTDASGNFSQIVDAPDSYFVSETAATNTAVWQQTGNINSEDQTSSSGGNFLIGLDNFVYKVYVEADGLTTGLNFGNVCVGAGGGLTLGYWGTHVGAPPKGKSSGPYVDAAALTLLNSLSLVWGDGKYVNVAVNAGRPLTTANVSGWFLNATATNMAYMLSVQLGTMELNVLKNGVSGSTLVYAPGLLAFVPHAGLVGLNAGGYISINNLMAAALSDLALSGHNVTIASGSVRAYQEALKTALDQANNNLTFVQATPATCAAPTFE